MAYSNVQRLPPRRFDSGGDPCSHRWAPSFRTALGLATQARAATFVALTDDSKLRRLDSAAPNSLGPEVTITGLQTGETIVGIDLRPHDNQLFGVGSTSRLYVINQFTGAATAVGSPGAFTLAGTDFGVDFNPVPDRLRVVSDADQNIRLNPNDGTLAGADAPLSYQMGDTNLGMNPNVVGSAYTNNFFGATSTTLYGLDSGNDVLTIQSPPDTGMLATVGPLGFNVSGMSGFDVLDDGSAFGVSGGSSASTFFSVNLATGQASVLGTVPDVLRGLAGEPTGAAGPFFGQLNRLAGNQLRFDVANGGRPVEFLAFELADLYSVRDVDIVSGPSAQCDPIPQSSAAQCGPFTAPNFWAGGGQGLGILIETNARYTDDAGVDLFVCAVRCFPFARDDGPFSFGGPFAVSQPPGPGNGTPPPDGGQTRDRFDTNGDGVVDALDIYGFVDAVVNQGGFSDDVNGPGFNQADVNLFIEQISAPAPAGASAAQRRRKRIVLARGRNTVRGGQTKRVRIPLTRPGRRYLRRYRRKRLRVTVSVRVRHTPAGVTAETRTFKRKATFRVKRKRR